MTLNSTLLVQANLSQVSALDLASTKFEPSIRKLVTLADGFGANQADRLFTDTRTLAASTTEDLDLAGGLVDAFGATLTLARVKGLIVVAAAGNTNNVQVGGAAANQFLNWVADATDKLNVRPGGVLALFAPDATAYAVTGATGDLLRIGNSGAGTSVTYDIVIIGASA